MSPRRVLVAALTVLGLVAIPALPASASPAAASASPVAQAPLAAAGPLAAASSSWPRVKQKKTAGNGAGFVLKAKKTRTVKIKRHASVPARASHLLVKIKVTRSKGSGYVKVWANGTTKGGLKKVRYGKGTTVKTVKIKTSGTGRVKFKSTRGVRVKVYTIGYERTATRSATPSRVGAASINGKTTGVPAGTRLKVHKGDLTITKNGTVIDGLDIRGFVRIKASDVTIKNSVIRGRAYNKDMHLVQASTGGKRITITDTEMYSANPSPYIKGIVGADFTLKRVNIHDVVDQVSIIGDNVTIEDSWLHRNLYYLKDPNYNGTPTHDDNIQISIGKNLRFVNNRMESTHNAAVMITQDRGHVRDVTFARNWVNGGACSVNIAEKKYGPLSGLKFTDNTFGTSTRLARCAILKPTSTPMTQSGNTFTDGHPFKVSRG